ncbi:MAG TPA: hypothetical protein VFA77_11965, partial [Candidatus Eisenbacteria bacterium]|nr:hypothetical protein [Candidatus Eisenbacteria bacterium]
ALRAFADDIYFHQVIARSQDCKLERFRDLDVALTRNSEPVTRNSSEALTRNSELGTRNSSEWRIHFHIPLHSPKTPLFDNTSDHILRLLDILQRQPDLCSHLEMETYTWEVMPPEMKNRNVVDQLVSEYEWCLAAMAERGIKSQVS